MNCVHARLAGMVTVAGTGAAVGFELVRLITVSPAGAPDSWSCTHVEPPLVTGLVVNETETGLGGAELTVKLRRRPRRDRCGRRGAISLPNARASTSRRRQRQHGARRVVQLTVEIFNRAEVRIARNLQVVAARLRIGTVAPRDRQRQRQGRAVGRRQRSQCRRHRVLVEPRRRSDSMAH